MKPDDPMTTAQTPRSFRTAPAADPGKDRPVRDFLWRFALVARELFAHPFTASAIAPGPGGYVVGRGKTLQDAVRAARDLAAARPGP